VWRRRSGAPGQDVRVDLAGRDRGPVRAARARVRAPSTMGSSAASAVPPQLRSVL